MVDGDPGGMRAAERRVVTVVFADLSGFTALAERIDAEEVRDLLNDCFAQLVPIVERHGGFVDKFLGDAIMALFGAPVDPGDDDAPHAVAAALEMVEAIAAFNASRGTDLGIHVGINTGPVIAGGLGSLGRRQYTVIGDTVNMAARLEQASESGEVLIGPETARLVEARFVLESRGRLRIPGKTAPLAAWLVRGPTS